MDLYWAPIGILGVTISSAAGIWKRHRHNLSRQNVIHIFYTRIHPNTFWLKIGERRSQHQGWVERRSQYSKFSRKFNLRQKSQLIEYNRKYVRYTQTYISSWLYLSGYLGDVRIWESPNSRPNSCSPWHSWKKVSLSTPLPWPTKWKMGCLVNTLYYSLFSQKFSHKLSQMVQNSKIVANK